MIVSLSRQFSTGNMKRFAFLLIILVGLGIAVAAFWRAAQPSEITSEITSLQAAKTDEGFARVDAVHPQVFPEDHGPHPDYQTEWWYYTGNLDSADGHHFGFQLTFFRHAISSKMPARTSDLATNQVYFAHFAITDVSSSSHFATERFSRGAADLAGATGSPFRVWLDDWEVNALSPDASSVHLRAQEGAHALDLNLTSEKPIVLHGNQGVSQKSDLEGDASFYYSFTRLTVNGELRVGDRQVQVQGLAWMDHEYGTTSLSDEAVGWDWFSVQLTDKREVMYFQIRNKDGSVAPVSGGTLVRQDGTSRLLRRDDVKLMASSKWTSPLGATYPLRWSLYIPSEHLSMDITPYVADQEMRVSIPYWEGAVHVSGVSGASPIDGQGYLEMTGYAGIKAPIR